MNSEHASATTSPLRPQDRIKELDVIRGFALLGILLVNMLYFKSPLLHTIQTPAEISGFWDQAGAWFIQLLATGKFYAIFSFLFGLGFYIFLERLTAKGLDPTSLYRRRLVGLMMFGLVHLILIWSGDILFSYSVVGFILIAFRDMELKLLSRWILVLFILAVLVEGGNYALYNLGELALGKEFAEYQAAHLQETMQVFREGGFMEILVFRLTTEVFSVLISLIFVIPVLLAYFLCGVYAGKIALFKNVGKHLQFINKIWRWGLCLGVMLTVIYVMINTGVLPVPSFWEYPLLAMINQAASIFLSAFYVTSLILLMQREFWKKVLVVLAAPGRMALTNYLTQSVICVLIFYGYGLGYFGQVSIGMGICLTLAIWLLQVFWSNWWMARFNYGPLEWLWRGFTYRQKPPMQNKKVM